MFINNKSWENFKKYYNRYVKKDNYLTCKKEVIEKEILESIYCGKVAKVGLLKLQKTQHFVCKYPKIC